MNTINFVNAGCLLMFPSSLRAQTRDDILLSSLYLQLTCNKTFPDFIDVGAWNSRYADAQKYLLYNASGRAKYEFFSSSPDKSVNLACVIREGMLTMLDKRELDSLNVLLEQFAVLDAQADCLQLLRRHAVQSAPDDGDKTSTLNRIRLQVGVVGESTKIKMITINLATRETIQTNFLHQEFSSSDIVGSVESEKFTAQLDEDYADSRRNTVIKTLNGRGDEAIRKLF